MKVKEFAKIAGVSPSTISKIIHHNDQNISAETKERILSLAKSAGFLPLQIAGKKTQNFLLGILLRNFSDFPKTKDLIEVLQTFGYQCILSSSENTDLGEKKQLNLLQARGVSLVLWEALNIEENQEILKEAQIPFLLLNEKGEKALSLDYQSFSYFLTQSLLQKGHNKIACLAVENAIQKDFIAGYSNCLTDYNLKVNTDFIFKEAESCKKYLLQNKCTALVSSSYAALIEMYYFLLQQSYSIPSDLSLLALAEETDTITEQLSALIIPRRDLAMHCANMVTEILEKQKDSSSSFQPVLKLNSEVSIQKKQGSSVPKVLVIGSINTDHYLSFKELPKRGTTTTTDKSFVYPGGKCLNQSIGLARLGLCPLPIAAIGSDMESTMLLNYLHKEKINTSGIKKYEKIQTGQAQIFLQEDGESMITIMSGANSYLSPEDIHKKKALFSKAKFCLLQTEVPISTIQTACEIAKQMNICTILKPSTGPIIPEALFPLIDFMIPNINEIMELIPHAKNYKLAAEELLRKGVQTVMVSLGAEGVYIKNRDMENLIPAIPVPVIDATGASDAFISAFTAYLAKGYSVLSAAKIANCAAALSVGKQGVAPALIEEDALEAFVRKQGFSLLPL
jgi:hypothetical protein